MEWDSYLSDAGLGAARDEHDEVKPCLSVKKTMLEGEGERLPAAWRSEV